MKNLSILYNSKFSLAPPKMRKYKTNYCYKCYKKTPIRYKYKYYGFFQKNRMVLLCKDCMKKALRCNYIITVYPKSPGDFGYCSISGVHEFPWETQEKCEEIKNQIKRHVDNVGDVRIDWDVYKPEEFWYE